MDAERTFSEMIDQPAFASKFDLRAARTAASFAKLCRDVLSLLDEGRRRFCVES
jgi:hypothetical protein